jgi:hypothetical protein
VNSGVPDEILFIYDDTIACLICEDTYGPIVFCYVFIIAGLICEDTYGPIVFCYIFIIAALVSMFHLMPNDYVLYLSPFMLCTMVGRKQNKTYLHHHGSIFDIHWKLIRVPGKNLKIEKNELA